MKNIGIFLLVLVFIGCHRDKKESEGLRKLPVTVPIRKDTVVFKEYVCVIKAKQQIEIRALEKGYLYKIHVDEGRWIRKGTLMFQILPIVYQAELQKAQAELTAAEIEYENTKALLDSQIVSPRQLALVKAKLEKARAEFNLALAHFKFTEIRAPFDGFTDRLHVRVGSLLEEGELLTTLSDNRELWVYFNVPERDYLEYMERVKADSTVLVRLKLANNTIFPYQGKITAIEADFDPTTGTVPFRATFPNPQLLLRDGQTGNILLEIPYPNALIIPQKATFDILDKTYVFVVNEEGKVEQRQIEIAAELPHILFSVPSYARKANDQEGTRGQVLWSRS
jgi:membrane fusion protein (multidrug efflux system)